MTMVDNVPVDVEVARLFSLEQSLLDDPYPVYERMRVEQPVIRWNNVVAVSRYADVKNALRDVTNLSSVRTTGTRHQMRMAELDDDGKRKMLELIANEDRWLVQTDDPTHANIRRFVNTAFSAAKIGEVRNGLEAITDELLADAEARNGEQLELVDALAYRLPLRAVCLLLGADRKDEELIRAWSDEIGTAIGTTYTNVDAAYDALENFRTYTRELIRKGRQDGQRTDLFASLISTAEDGTALGEDDLVAMFILLLFAGHETTTNLISNATVAILENPEQATILRENPALVRPAIEEFLRYNTSVQAVHRVAVRDFELAGFPVAQGESVRLLLGSANRDPEVFQNPAVLDVTRKNAKMHLGLGYGIHSCLGMWLVRLETEIALQALLHRYDELRLLGPTPMRKNFTLHGPDSVPLGYTLATPGTPAPPEA